MTKSEHIYCMNRNKKHYTKEKLLSMAEFLKSKGLVVNINARMKRDDMVDILATNLEKRDNEIARKYNFGR